MHTIRKVLIANRGEIAVRIIRTAHNLGIECVSVYSVADAKHPHVRLADQAIAIGGPSVGDSYLVIEKLIDAAHRTGADAIHPGYGLLAENPDFARACADNNLIFIGPPAQTIYLMGNKANAKRRMQEAGIPVIPGYQGEDQTLDTLLAEAQRIGTPLMVKAAAGGGGRGMRLVTDMHALEDAISSARSEAQNSFANDELILERAISGARHIEVQVFADVHGNVLHLGERDCSVQRRHQKLIEESPSPVVDDELRSKMGQTACEAVRAIEYLGAGTIEFLLSEDRQFYFMEMNTRLQVEHAVTEMITGIDLVAWQFAVAEGKQLPLSQEQLVFDGHAIEVRLCAEDVTTGFLPQSGQINYWQAGNGKGIRVDHGLLTGQTISPYYDSMLAKIIAHGDDRGDAIRRLQQAVKETTLFGLTSNKAFLSGILAHPEFQSGAADTNFINSIPVTEIASTPAVESRLLAIATIILFQREQTTEQLALSTDNYFLWPIQIESMDGIIQAQVQVIENNYRFVLNEISHTITDYHQSENLISLSLDTIQYRLKYCFAGTWLYLDWGDHTYRFSEKRNEVGGHDTDDDELCLRAPMNGQVIDIRVAVGQQVNKGDIVIVIEAMKMQHQLTTRRNAVIESIHVSVNDIVDPKASLVTLSEAIK